MNAATIEKKIQLGISLAKAREMFPDIKQHEGPLGALPETWFTSSKVTDGVCNYAVLYVGDTLHPCVKFGEVLVFGTDAFDRQYEEFGPNTLSGTMLRIMSHPAGREAFLAAMTEETWSKYVLSLR